METQLLPPHEAALRYASELLSAGQLVAFPTETVYGLGANALDDSAVRSIFAAKGRPADNPLIVHIYDVSQLDGMAEMPAKARKLADAFWPGPLTLLMRKTDRIPSVVTANLPTVAVRMPSHPVAQALLRECALPIAAPSANLSGKPSPTTAEAVLQDMQGRIPLILDGGSCQIGLESTVVDATGDEAVILRPGGITREMLQDALGENVAVAGSVLRPLREGEKALSPGMRYRHYAPNGEVILITGAADEVVEALKLLCTRAESKGFRVGTLCFSEHVNELSRWHPHDMGRQDQPGTVAHRLFDLLRQLDEEQLQLIFSEVLPPEGMGLAVMNRLGRAAAFREISARSVLTTNGGEQDAGGTEGTGL